MSDSSELEAVVRNAVCDELLSGSPDGILVYDREMRYLMWNPAMERLSGVAASAVIGKPCLEVFPFLGEIGEDQRMAQTLSGERIVSENKPFVTSSGKCGYFDGFYSPISSSDGNVIAGYGLIKDATKRSLMNEFMNLDASTDILGDSLREVNPQLAAALGRTISARRKIIGLSQEELADRACLHRTYISDVERSARSISIATLEKFSSALRIRAWVLLAVAESHFVDSEELKLAGHQP